MMKFSGFVTIITSVVALTGSSIRPAQAGLFSDMAVPNDRIIAIAAPYNEGLHQLLVVQQLGREQPCWQELPAISNGTIANGTVAVEPLLGNFDFTGICGRSTDSNGYSIRLGNQDLGWRYSLQVEKQDDDLHLVGVATNNRKAPKLRIGQVGGWREGFVKIHLNPGWRMTQRTYLGEPLGHFYFTHDQSLAAFAATTTAARPSQAIPSQSMPSQSPNRVAKF
jgi:hypothetical protein